MTSRQAIHITIDASLLKRVDELAKASGLTRSELFSNYARAAITPALKADPKTGPYEDGPKMDYYREVAGRIDAGLPMSPGRVPKMPVPPPGIGRDGKEFGAIPDRRRPWYQRLLRWFVGADA